MGLTIVDAGVIIGVLDADDEHHASSRGLLAAAVADGDVLAVPASAYAEVLVGPARRGKAAIRAVIDFLADLPADVEPITRQSAAKAAELRARHGARLRLPDALVVAAAIQLKADRIITTDRRWPKLPIRVDVA